MEWQQLWLLRQVWQAIRTRWPRWSLSWGRRHRGRWRRRHRGRRRRRRGKEEERGRRMRGEEEGRRRRRRRMFFKKLMLFLVVSLSGCVLTILKQVTQLKLNPTQLVAQTVQFTFRRLRTGNRRRSWQQQPRKGGKTLSYIHEARLVESVYLFHNLLSFCGCFLYAELLIY